MGSFYGGGCACNGSGGGSGTSDYNALSNRPITNLNGTDEINFINLGGLDAGRYNLKGFYKKDSQSELQEASEPVDLIVSYDDSTGKKVVHYFTIENEILYSVLIIYNRGLVETISKTPLGGDIEAQLYWGQI